MEEWGESVSGGWRDLGTTETGVETGNSIRMTRFSPRLYTASILPGTHSLMERRITAGNRWKTRTPSGAASLTRLFDSNYFLSPCRLPCGRVSQFPETALFRPSACVTGDDPLRPACLFAASATGTANSFFSILLETDAGYLAWGSRRGRFYIPLCLPFVLGGSLLYRVPLVNVYRD